MFKLLSARRGFGLWMFAGVSAGTDLVVGFDRTAVGDGAILLIALAANALQARRHRHAYGNGTRFRAGALWTAVIAGALAELATITALAVSIGAIGTATRVLRVLRPMHDAGAHVLLQRQSHVRAPWTIVIELLVIGAAASFVLAVRALRPPSFPSDSSSDDALSLAQGIVQEHGRDSLAPFVLAPGKTLEFAGGGVLGYRLIGETAVVSGDPVGPSGSAPLVVAQLLARAHTAGARVVLYGSSAENLNAYRALGLRAMCVGEEAVVDPASFTLDGRAVRKLRQSVNRIERRGWRVETYEGRDIDPRLEAEIDAVEAAWRSKRTRILGFAMSFGEFDPGVRPHDVYVLARSHEGELRGVMRFLTHCGNLSLDTMRRVGETPNGLNEAMVCAALRHAHSHDVDEVSLNYAGLAHLVRSGPPGGLVRRALTRAAVGVLARRFQMDRLVLFNQKFSPTWRPRYLVYESRAALPRSVFRALQAEGYVPERRRRLARRSPGDGGSLPGVTSFATRIDRDLGR